MTRRATPSRSELARKAKAAPVAPAASRQHPELEHVPTLLELSTRGLALLVAPNVYTPTHAGQALLNATMDRNATRLRNEPDLRALVEAAAFRRPRDPLS